MPKAIKPSNDFVFGSTQKTTKDMNVTQKEFAKNVAIDICKWNQDLRILKEKERLILSLLWLRAPLMLQVKPCQ